MQLVFLRKNVFLLPVRMHSFRLHNFKNLVQLVAQLQLEVYIDLLHYQVKLLLLRKVLQVFLVHKFQTRLNLHLILRLFKVILLYFKQREHLLAFFDSAVDRLYLGLEIHYLLFAYKLQKYFLHLKRTNSFLLKFVLEHIDTQLLNPDTNLLLETFFLVNL